MSGSSKLPQGYLFSGLASGIKAKKRDLALIVSTVPACGAGTFTRAALRAAPVRFSEGLLPASAVRAVVVASGNANAMTGPDGDAANARLARVVARRLDVSDNAVLTACTGVIGVPFPIDRVEAATPALVEALSDEPEKAAEAILTTDTFTKTATREIYLGGARVRVFGMAKGSGMVHPNMATVLGFVLTDAAIALQALDALLRDVVDETFNALSVDGATSTNDSVFALANGLAQNAPIEDAHSPAGAALRAALLDVCRQLAQAVARDGEGARKLLSVMVRGAPDKKTARELGRAIVSSSLVKAAMFGADPSPGRVLAALGSRASSLGVAIEEARLSMWMQGVLVFDRGRPLTVDQDGLRGKLRQRDVVVEVDLAGGPAAAEAWGCDLTYDYVRINADYAAVLVDPDGPVRRDPRLETKTPELKTEILVSALKYIERFAHTRAVIRFGRATLARPDLAQTFAEDVRLLKAVGLSPILVQEGNSELMVNLLAQASVRAVGLSGADGHLLTWADDAEAPRSEPRAPDRRSTPPRPELAALDTPRVDPDIVEMLLSRGYVPVIVPEFTEALSEVHPARVDAVAAELAVVCKAKKLILLGESAGLLSDGLLVSELSAEELWARLRAGTFTEPMWSRAAAAARALGGGVDSVHFLDERTHHVVVAELFTDSGVGTMVR